MLELGNYPLVSLKEARIKRDFYQTLLIDNINPAQHKKDEKIKLAVKEQVSQTFNFYFDEWLSKNKNNWSNKHLKEIPKRANKHPLPHIGNMAIIDTDTPKIIEVLRKIEH